MYNYHNDKFGQDIRDICSDIYKLADAVNHKPTWQQRQLYDAVMRGEGRIAIKAGMGPGKTCATSLVAAFRTMRHYMGLTVVTAPTMRQCKEVFMGELRRHVEKGTPLIRRIINVGQTRATFFGKADWHIRSATARKQANIFGNHNENMTIICEEASGISREIMDALKGTMSNPNSLVIKIGNPNDRDTDFFDCFHTLKNRWNCMTWNAEETPESPWFTQQRNRDIAEEFGRDSDMYRISVLGEFPHTNPNSVFSDEMLERCYDRGNIFKATRCPRIDGRPPAKQFGLDFAFMGGDENTIFRRSGNAIAEWGFFPRTDPYDVVQTAFQWQKKAGWRDDEALFVPDAGGMGQGVIGNFNRAEKMYFPFHFNGKPTNKKKYKNLITEAWFNMALIVREKPCFLPNDSTLRKQLTSRRYFPDKDGVIVLEPKPDYMRRGNDSPDRADGIVLAYYDRAIVPGSISQTQKSLHHIGMEVR